MTVQINQVYRHHSGRTYVINALYNTDSVKADFVPTAGFSLYDGDASSSWSRPIDAFLDPEKFTLLPALSELNAVAPSIKLSSSLYPIVSKEHGMLYWDALMELYGASAFHEMPYPHFLSLLPENDTAWSSISVNKSYPIVVGLRARYSVSDDVNDAGRLEFKLDLHGHLNDVKKLLSQAEILDRKFPRTFALLNNIS